MDNKRIYKKIATIFWFLLAISPLILSFIGAWVSTCIYTGNNTLIDLSHGDNIYYGESFNAHFLHFLNDDCFFYQLIPNWFTNSIYNVLDTIGIDLSEAFANCCVVCISWFIWVYILELLIDIFVWLPKFIHKLLEKYGGVD